MCRASPQLERLVPHKKRRPQRPQAQHREQPPVARLQCHRRLQRHMAQQRQRAGHQPEQANGRGRERCHALGHERIRGPDESRCQRGQVAPGQRAAQLAPAGNGNGRAAKTQQRRQHMRQAQRHTGQHHRREHHDEQRPQVVDEVGLHRRGMAQRDEQQKVVRKQAVHAQRQRAQRDAPLCRVTKHKRPGRHAADDERNACEQEGRNVGEGHPQGSERGPQRNGAQGIEVGLHGAELTRARCGESSRNTGESSRAKVLAWLPAVAGRYVCCSARRNAAVKAEGER